MCTCMREKRKILTRGKYRWMVMNQNQILFFNITVTNGTDAHVKREKKEIHLKKREAQKREAQKREAQKREAQIKDTPKQ